MYKYFLTVLIVFNLSTSYAQKTYKYPTAPKDSIVDFYFGVSITDSYQWMEDPNDPRLAEWKKAQKKITKKEKRKHVKALTLSAQIGSLYNDVKMNTIDGYVEQEDKSKSKYEFDYEFNRQDRFPNLMYRRRGTDHFHTLVKSKKFKAGKKDNIQITNRYVNEAFDLVAIEMSHNGSDWREVYFFDLKTGKQLPDTLKNLRFTTNIVWHKRNIYYDGYEEPIKGRELLDKAKGQKLYFHKLGDPQSEDVLLYQNPDPTGTNLFHFFKFGDKIFMYHFANVRGEALRMLSVANDEPESFKLKNFLVYPSSNAIDLSIQEILGDSVILKTNWDAPNGRVLLSDMSQLNKVTEFIPEYDVALETVNRLGKDKLACIYRSESHNLVLIFNMAGELIKKIDFPEGKKVNYFSENDPAAEYTDFSVSSFYHPDLWYQLSLKDLTFKPSASVSVPYDSKSLETRCVKYTSKDGTQIPMYITCLKKTKLNGKNPTLIYAYGGYGYTVEPAFDESKALWLLHGGILAVPNIRGGGAKGSEWGKAGRRLNKQNAIDDFIAAAEYLIDERYTNQSRLAINGASHGGLLVGAAITQRPRLFKAAIAEAGPYDMLRFQNFTIGDVNTSIQEFGNCSDSLDFVNLKSYSPLHNIKKGVAYPNVLLMSGDSDDRVPPLHAYKFLAALQENGSPRSQYLLYLTPGAGHGGALTSKDWIDEMLFKYYFLFDQLDLKFD